ncbi:MAG: DUF3592 domain-containing protein [Planctomycetota bacterium]|jgi:hypothetical protein
MDIEIEGEGSSSGAKTIIGCALAVIGSIMLGFLVMIAIFGAIGVTHMYRQAGLMERAVETPATIVTSTVREIRISTSGAGGAGGIAHRSTSNTYAPAVTFTYEYDGVPRESERVFIVPTNGQRSWANEVLRDYPDGAAVVAWVDPDAPDEAFLVHRWGLSPYAMVLTAGVLLGFLMSMVSFILLLFPRLSTGAALIGLVGWLVLPLWAGLHYWTNARAGDAGFGTPEIIGTAVLVLSPLPLLACLLGKRIRRKYAAQAA